MVRQARIPGKLFVWRQVQSGGRNYPPGSRLAWRDNGLSERAVVLLIAKKSLSDKPWPGADAEVESEDMDVETGEERSARDEREAEAKQAAEQLALAYEAKVVELKLEGFTQVEAEELAVPERE